MSKPKPSIPREIVRYYEINALGQFGWLVTDSGKKVNGYLYNGIFYTLEENDLKLKRNSTERKKASKPTDTL